MAESRLSDLFPNSGVTQTVSGSTSTTTVPSAAAVNTVIATKATIISVTDLSTPISFVQGYYYVIMNLMYKRTGANAQDVPTAILTDTANFSKIIGNPFGFIGTSLNVIEDAATWSSGVTLGGGSNYNTFGRYQINTVLGNVCQYNYFGKFYTNNTFGPVTKYCKFGDYLDSNSFGQEMQLSTVGNQVNNCTVQQQAYNLKIGNRVRYCTVGAVTNRVTIGDDCAYVQVGGNCTGVEIYNCQGTSSAPFIIPQGATNVTYRNNSIIPIINNPYEIGGVKPAVTSSGASWINGEYQGSQPIGSKPGMIFCDANYRYEFMLSYNDTSGTNFVWVRTVKGTATS